MLARRTWRSYYSTRDLIDDVDVDAHDLVVVGRLAAEGIDEGRVVGVAAISGIASGRRVVARPRPAGDLAERVQLVVGLGVRVLHRYP
jgi:hypothetical protein